MIFSKENTNIVDVSDYSRKIITLYYYEMIENLSKVLDVDLFEKWDIESDKEKLWKY